MQLRLCTHVSLTYFFKSVISFTSSHWQMWEGEGSGVMPWGLTRTFPQQQTACFNWCGLEKTMPWLVLMQSHYTTTCFSFIMCNTYLAWINSEMSVPPNPSSDMLSTLMALQCKHTVLYCWDLIWTIKSPWHSQYGKSLQPGQFRVQTIVSARDFLFSTPTHTSSWAPPASCTMGTCALFQR